jgi:hypothetical protein
MQDVDPRDKPGGGGILGVSTQLDHALGPVSTPIQAIFGAVVEVRFGQFRLIRRRVVSTQ